MFAVVQRYYHNGNIMVQLRRAFENEDSHEYQLDGMDVYIDIVKSFDNAILLIAGVRNAI